MDGIDFAEEVIRIYNYYKKDGGSFTPEILTNEMKKIANTLVSRMDAEVKPEIAYLFYKPEAGKYKSEFIKNNLIINESTPTNEIWVVYKDGYIQKFKV